MNKKKGNLYDDEKLLAQESLFAEQKENLLRYAYSRCQDWSLAEDAVQDTFAKLLQQDWQKIHAYAVPWLFKVCRSKLLDAYRKDSRMKTMPPKAELPDENTRSAIGQLEAQEKNAAILQLIQTLPGNQQEVIRLRFQSDLSYKEIAEVTELTVSNVGYLLHHALQSLRTQLITQ